MVRLKVYDTSVKLCAEVYAFTRAGGLRRDFALASQLQRAAVSVPANISEGYMRTKKVFNNHLSIAVGSSNEVKTLLKVASLVHDVRSEELQEEYEALAKQMSSLRNRLY